MSLQFNKPQKVTAKVYTVTKISEKDVEVIFEVISPTEFNFIAGQFINLHCGNGIYRAYSISTSPFDVHHVGIIAAVGHEGVGSNYLRSLQVGDDVEFIGPSGRFVLPETLNSSLVFIATGTGLAPLLSMLEYLNSIKCPSNIILYFGVRDTHDLFKMDQLTKLKSSMVSFEYKVCFSQEVPPNFTNDTGIKGRVTDVISDDLSKLKNAQYFICGNPYMVLDMTTILTNYGVSTYDIFHEKFTVSKQPTS